MPWNHLRPVGVALLVTIGLANSIAYLTNMPWLGTFALATAASPLPRAFSQSQSLVGFATELTLEITGEDNRVERRTESSELFARLPGPYERRVLYGAALSFAPISSHPLFASILRYGFCRSGPLAVRLGVHQPLRSVALVGASFVRPGAGGRVRRVTIECGPDVSAR